MDEIKIPWDDWVLGKKLGQGSFGAVYEIQREITGGIEKSALKIIRFPQSEDEVEDLQDSGMDDQSIRARFIDQANGIKKEYGIMARLKGCTNVVYCDDLYEETGADGFSRTLYLKMELLKPLIKTLRTSYDPEEVARAVGTDICKALVACEKENIVHRDIKPQNTFVSNDGVYKLGDFGVARTMEKTMNGTKAGTYHFMAPEVYRGEDYGKRVDIYSLGMLIYWLLNEKRGPFMPLPPENVTIASEEEARRKRFSGEPLPPPKNGSDALKAIVLKACAFNPEDRFQHAEEMLDALKGKTVVADTSAEEEIAAEEPAEDTGLDATVGAFADHQKSRKKQCTAPELGEGVFGDQTMREETDSHEEMHKKIVQQNEAKKLEEEQRKKRRQEEQRRKQEQEEQQRKREKEEQQKKREIEEQQKKRKQDEAKGPGIIVVLLYTAFVAYFFLSLYEGDSESLWWRLPLLAMTWIPFGDVIDEVEQGATVGTFFKKFSLPLIALCSLFFITNNLEVNLFNYLLLSISAIITLIFMIKNLCLNLAILWLLLTDDL